MKFAWSELTVSTANLLMSVLALIATIVLALYLSHSGSIPPKSVMTEFTGPIDPFGDLATSGPKITVDVKVAGNRLENVYVYRTYLQNTGTAPIIPADFIGNISIEAKDPWTIVAIGKEADASTQTLSLSWTKESATKFSAEPTLINPGDTVTATIYLTTADEEAAKKKKDADADVPLKWGMRVINLPSVDVRPDPVTRMKDAQGPIMVLIWGWGVPLVLVFFTLSLWIHLTVIIRGTGRHLTFWHVPWILASGILSVCAAEALTTYVIGAWPGVSTNQHLANIPPIIANVLLVIGLALWHRKNADDARPM
jgi:hypothetical protein